MLYAKDKVTNVSQQIRQNIEVTFEKGCYSATIILVFSAIDAMANLNRPSGQLVSSPDDFKNWCSKYLITDTSQAKISADEWWEARNSIIHNFSATSKKHLKEPGIRKLGWKLDNKSPVIFNRKISEELVLVDIKHLKDIFLTGFTKFLIEIFANKDTERIKIIEERFEDLLNVYVRES
jgi:hypothetical protein